MKQIRPCVDFNLFVICVLVGLSAAISGDGQIVPDGMPSNPATTVPASFDIHGTVVNETPDYSPKIFDKLEHVTAKSSEDEFSRILEEMYKASPAPKVVVTAQGKSLIKKVFTDSQGKFTFSGLPGGDYKLFAGMLPSSSKAGEKRMAVEEPIEIRLNQNISALEMNVRSDLVDVRGRITDIQGRPIAGAKVRGEHYPMPDSSDVEKAHPARFALSGADGSYELRGFIPLDVYRITGYLVGGDPTESGLNPFYVKVYVEADGFVQSKARVPLVTEELLGPSRRLLKALSQMAVKNGGSELQEKKDIPLPASHGNTITGIDIVLKKAGDDVP